MTAPPAVPGGGDRRDFLANDLDQRVRADGGGDGIGEAPAIDGQRRAGGHARRVGTPHDDRPEPAHLFLEHADGVVEFVAAEAVAADEFGEAIALMDQGRAHGTHLVQAHPHAS